MEKYHVLVVEDDNEIANAIKIYLENQGYDVYVGNDGLEGLEIIEKETIHLAIVDIMMPRMDGLTMVSKLREKYDFPVIFLSAKSEDIDKIMGLNLGGDDYVTKPFVPMELMARVRSHLRRYGRYLDATAPKESDHVYICGGLELNVDTKTVSVDGKNVKVTPIEFKILELLMKNAGKVFSADDIYERVWNEEAINSETVMVHVRNLREKIEINPKKPQYLKVVWGVGYKIDKTIGGNMKNKNRLLKILLFSVLIIASLVTYLSYGVKEKMTSTKLDFDNNRSRITEILTSKSILLDMKIQRRKGNL